MKKVFISFIFSLFFTSCLPKLIPIKGNYPKPPFQITSNSSFEQVWDNLIDLFAQKGFSIKIIDKSSGLITSEKGIMSTTIEYENGTLKNPEAFFVVPQLYLPGPMKYEPLVGSSDVVGEWNVRIKQVNGQVVINVNVFNLQYSYFEPTTKSIKVLFLTDYKSTGYFEKYIADKIK